MNETIEFAIFLTGHDKKTIEQMYDQWKKYHNKWTELSGDTTKRTFCPQCGKPETSKGDGTIELLCECKITNL